VTVLYINLKFNFMGFLSIGNRKKNCNKAEIKLQKQAQKLALEEEKKERQRMSFLGSSNQNLNFKVKFA